jgi:succinylglutamate desuccinylase
MATQSLPAAQLPAEIAVLVLAEFIRNPKSDFEQLARALACSKSVTVEVAQIARLFEQHDLKKTMRTLAPRS